MSQGKEIEAEPLTRDPATGELTLAGWLDEMTEVPLLPPGTLTILDRITEYTGMQMPDLPPRVQMFVQVSTSLGGTLPPWRWG